MIKFLRDSLKRRRLRLVVKGLPQVLRQCYGRQEFYTAGQVATAAKLLKLRRGLMPSAFATACATPEFLAAQPDLNEEDYMNLRTDIAELFWLDEEKLNCRTLTSEFRNPIGPAIGVDPVSGLDVGGNGGGGNW